ncbi:ArgS-related anticodon-binding protein NrtL [Streptomyces sp. NPDC058662]|uniref:ArgS-related anticodon-binding protein NrtL n=1 Tax=Streptomyces sp. NPDC058662 TaxID=3346583 RepID=UPI003665CDEA
MNPADLPRTVARAVCCAVEEGELPAGVEVPGRVVVERTRPGGVGEYATPVAFQVAGSAGRRPAEVAGVLARRLGAVPGIERVDVTGAGFLNFVLAPLSPARIVALAAEAHSYPKADPYPDPDLDLDPNPRQCPCAPTRRRASAFDALDAADSPDSPDAPGGLRERVVRAAVGRILRVWGCVGEEHPAPVAPVAKRDGDVLARYGSDAARWAMLVVPARETPEFSDVLLVQGEASEFFRVRYAHARAHALVANAARLGFRPLPSDPADTSEAPETPDTPDTTTAPLLRALVDHALVLEAAAHHRAPERLARHLVEVADALLDFQYRVLPHGDEKPSAAHRSRLALAEAAGTVLAGGLALLGIDAPTRL